MTNDDLKRFYPQNSTLEKSNDFVRYNTNEEIPGVSEEQIVSFICKGIIYGIH